MKVIEKYNDDLHNPYWRYQLGPEAYEVKDTPKRVACIKKALRASREFEFIKANHYPDRFIVPFHPYHDYIKYVSETQISDEEEFYPDLFPGEGAHLPKRIDNVLWGGIWCTDAVTPIKKKTYEVARASAETALTGAELIRDGSERAVYSLCRPSGHHAGPRLFGGYCYFNNVATAAKYLMAKGIPAIVDIDYHHGNGTQEFFQESCSVFTASIHCDPNVEYPYFWGYSEEVGIGQGAGANLNIPLAKETGADIYFKAVDKVVQAIKQYGADYLVIAAGFDTHKDDPIGGFLLQNDDYLEIGKRFNSLGLPTLICQEGGYNTECLGECVLNFLSGF